jgi:hypothetical protein
MKERRAGEMEADLAFSRRLKAPRLRARPGRGRLAGVAAPVGR